MKYLPLCIEQPLTATSIFLSSWYINNTYTGILSSIFACIIW